MISSNSAFRAKKWRKICAFGFLATSGFAQEAVVVAAGDATGSGGSSSYTVGQMIYSSDVGSTGSVTSGLQQPFEISVVSSLPQGSLITLGLSVSLKQNLDVLTLNLNGVSLKDLSYQIINADGQVLSTQKLNSNTTFISMSEFSNSVYFLKITKNDAIIKTFQIHKGTSK